MNTLFAEILDKIEQIPVRRGDVRRLLRKMEHDLKAAEEETAADWIVKKVYEAILTGCAALMAARGYRTKSGSWHHYATIRFAQLALPVHANLLDRGEMLRRRRHQVTYGASYVVSEEEAESTLEFARGLTRILKEAASSG